MSSKNHKISQKLFIIRTYKKVSQIETVVSNIVQKKNIQLQLSILGKLTGNNIISKNKLQKSTVNIKQQLSIVLGKEFQFGFFFNPDIGCLFIAGHLTPTFLNKVDDSELASLPAGLSGIFRGIGIPLENINNFLIKLKNDNYCLIIRGESSVLDTIEPLLEVY